MRVLIAHAEGEEQIAESIAMPLRDAGYIVSHRGTVLVGESVVEEASKALQCGAPVVLCGTVKALGTGWAHRLVNAAHRHPEVRVYPLQVERDAYLESLSTDERALPYWQDPSDAITALLAAIQSHYPGAAGRASVRSSSEAEARYRELALEACDIIDLANLPEMDRNVATRELELRRLYVALRVHVANDSTGTSAGHRTRDDTVPDLTPDFAGIEFEADFPAHDPAAVGERLAAARRLIVLGDPGAGKTTLLRWIATAYLLRLKDDPDLQHLPDVATLPAENWLPVMVRCRELLSSMITGSLDDILLATLRKTELTAAEIDAMGELLRAKLVAGDALLMIDGLDEIADTRARTRFCRKLEQIHVAYPAVPVIVTSRIVGYREMNYRLGRGFEHVTVAELSREDKDDFAKRWCAVTEVKERQVVATRELIRDIHSMDRIERLTGNPMLLTTMALVKRKVGKLPNRRADLYWDAVEVLLNWRGEVDAPIDHHEAVPQLEYIAYTMCERGVQQLREDEVLRLLEQMRSEYPQVHAIHLRAPHEFLHELERRTGILSESGYVRHRGRPVAVFEFRHLTFQEYLAGLALVDGRHPKRNRSLSLAERVAPLAAQPRGRSGALGKGALRDAWREALRLCVTSCNDDDVDEVLLAILHPLAGEGSPQQTSHRVTLAAQCLADEPNVSVGVATLILEEFAEVTGSMDIHGSGETLAEHAAAELLGSRWARQLRRLLIKGFVNGSTEEMRVYGSLAATGDELAGLPSRAARNRWFASRARALQQGNVERKCEAALRLMQAMFNYSGVSAETFDIRQGVVTEVIRGLVDMLDQAAPCQHAAAWALFWCIGGHGRLQPANVRFRFMVPKWRLEDRMAARVVSYLKRERREQPVARFLLTALGGSGAVPAVEVAASYASHPDNGVAQAAVGALGEVDSAVAWRELCKIVECGYEYPERVVAGAVSGLIGSTGVWGRRARDVGLMSSHESVRREAVYLSALRLSAFKRTLLSCDLDGAQPFIDPADEIDDARVRAAALRTSKSEGFIREEYERTVETVGLKLSWLAVPGRHGEAPSEAQ